MNRAMPQNDISSILKKLEGIEKTVLKQHQLQQTHQQQLKEQYQQLQQQNFNFQQTEEEEQQLVPFTFSRFLNNTDITFQTSNIPTFYTSPTQSASLLLNQPSSSTSFSSASKLFSTTTPQLKKDISKYALKLIKESFSRTELSLSTLSGKRSHGILDPHKIKKIKEITMKNLGVSDLNWNDSLSHLGKRLLELRKSFRKKNNDKQ